MKHSTHMTALLRHVTTARDFCRWLEDDGDMLIATADLLGGPDWAERAQAVVAVARNGGPVSARVRTLAALSRLLHCAHTDGLVRWPVPDLHPDDPRATGAMLEACRAMETAVQRRRLAEEFVAEADQARQMQLDPYHLHWETTPDGASL
jgi:hypothetical protein